MSVAAASLRVPDPALRVAADDCACSPRRCEGQPLFCGETATESPAATSVLRIGFPACECQPCTTVGFPYGVSARARQRQPRTSERRKLRVCLIPQHALT